MNRLPAFLVAAIAAVAFVASGCGAVAPYAATVDGERITKDELDAELEAIRGNETYLESLEQSQASQGLAVQGRGNSTFDAAFVAQILTRRIFLEIVHQKVVDDRIRVRSEDVQAAQRELEASFGEEATLEKFPDEFVEEIVRSSAEVSVLRDHLARREVSDADVEKYYREQQGQFSTTCVSHILVETKPQADAARARIAGGEDFGAVARVESKDLRSGEEGGSLGCLTSTEAAGFVAPFREAMQSLPVNEVSQPVETQFGFHVIKVTSREPQPLSEVRDEIRQQLSGGQAGAAFEEFLLEAVADADIDVNPRYGRWDPGDRETGQPPRVEPPRKPATSTTAAGPAETPFPGAPGGGAPQPTPDDQTPTDE